VLILPALAVGVLQVIETAGLGEHFTVVGTHALYAYESAAGVRIAQGALATQDVDLLWDARKRVRFLTDIDRLDTSIEDDIWPVQARRASVLTTAPRFEHVVVSATGRMALMRTIAPQAFIDFKLWLAEKAADRPESKRRRDRHQAAIVQELLDAGLLV